MAPPDDDDTFDPTPTELLPGGDDGAFDPQATEQLSAPGAAQPGPKPFDASEGDTEAISVEHSDATAIGEGPTAPDLKGRPPSRDDAATALIPGHALGLNGEPEIDDLTSSKFLAGAAEAVADPFAGPVDELSSSGSPTPRQVTPSGPSPIVDDDAGPRAPHDPTGAWEGLPLAKALEPTGETEAPRKKNRRSRTGCLALLTVLGVVAIGGGAAWWFVFRSAEGPVVAEAVVQRPPPVPEPVEPPTPINDTPAEPEAPADDEERVDDDEPSDEIEEDAPRRRRKKRKRRQARRKRQRGPPPQVASAPAVGQTTMSVGKLKDVSGAGITSLRATLARTLKRRLKGQRGVHLVGGRPSKGFVIDAWVQKVRKKKVDGGNMVEVACSAALSEQPGGGVKFNTRATTGVGVSEKLTRSLIEELASDALVRCANEMAKDIARYGARKAR